MGLDIIHKVLSVFSPHSKNINVIYKRSQKQGLGLLQPRKSTLEETLKDTWSKTAFHGICYGM